MAYFEGCKKGKLEYLRFQADQKFNQVKSWWIDCGRWALPYTVRSLTGEMAGYRNNQHIVDATHLLALRSYTAGFLEGNTSASRPWYKLQSANPKKRKIQSVKQWTEDFTGRTLKVLGDSNFYIAAGIAYAHLGVFNTCALFIDELPGGKLYWHNLDPGSYRVLNNGRGEAVILIRTMQLTVLSLVETYGKKVNGTLDMANFSYRVRNLYERNNLTQLIDVVHIVMPNDMYENDKPAGGKNRKWVSLTYELGGQYGQYYQNGMDGEYSVQTSGDDPELFLDVSYSKRKPFIIGKAESSEQFEYGEKGPTLDALGAIKSLNKKAISKDQALEQMLRPAMQGPASLKKSYITSAANSFVPLDPTSIARGSKVEPINQMNPAISALVQDTGDLRDQVGKLYYMDYLLYLSQNPKTRTATETNAVVSEQQLIIGPILQSLNKTFNEPVVDFVSSYVLDEDPFLDPPPPELSGEKIITDFISVFAQAQKAADLPSIDRATAMIEQVGQINPDIFDKYNFDFLADLYEDRLYLPAGLVRPQPDVDKTRAQREQQKQQQQALEQTIPAMAQAKKNIAAAGQGQQ